MHSPLVSIVLLALTATAWPAEFTNQFTVRQRLERDRLQAAHETRTRWARERAPVPELTAYRDYRALLHIHAEDSNHTRGTRAEVLAAAKKTGVQVVMFSDHRGPKPETWRGFRDGVLFFAGSEDGDGVLRYPTFDDQGHPSTNDALRFISHVEAMQISALL